MSKTAVVMSIETLFENINSAMALNRIDKIVSLKEQLDSIVSAVVRTNDIATLSILHEKSMQMILSEHAKASFMMIIFGWKEEEVRDICANIKSKNISSLPWEVVFTKSNIDSFVEQEAPVHLLGESYVNLVRAMKLRMTEHNAIEEDCPKEFADLEDAIKAQDIVKAKTIAQSLKSMLYFSLFSRNISQYTFVLNGLATLVTRLYMDAKLFEVLPLIVDFDDDEVALIRESVLTGNTDVVLKILNISVMESEGKYFFRDIADSQEFNSALSSYMDSLREPRSLKPKSAFSHFVEMMVDLKHTSCTGDYVLSAEKLKAATSYILGSSHDISTSLFDIYGIDSADVSILESVVQTMDHDAVAIDLALVLNKIEVYSDVRSVRPSFTAEGLMKVLSITLEEDLLSVLDNNLSKIYDWSISKPLNSRLIFANVFVVGEILSVIAASENVKLLESAVKRVHAKLVEVYTDSSSEALTKALREVPFDFKHKIIDSLRSKNEAKCLQALVDVALLDSIKRNLDDIYSGDDYFSVKSKAGAVSKYHKNLKVFHRAVYTALGFPEELDLTDIYVSNEYDHEKETSLVNTKLDSKDLKTDLAEDLEGQLVSDEISLEDFVNKCIGVRASLNELVQNSNHEQFAKDVVAVKAVVVSLISANKYDLAVLLTVIVQLESNRKPEERLVNLAQVALDAIVDEPSLFVNSLIVNNVAFPMERGVVTSVRKVKKDSLSSANKLTDFPVDYTDRGSVKGYIDTLIGSVTLQNCNSVSVRLSQLFATLLVFTEDRNQARLYASAMLHTLERLKDKTALNISLLSGISIVNINGSELELLQTSEGRKSIYAKQILSERFNYVCYTLGCYKPDSMKSLRANLLHRTMPDISILPRLIRDASTKTLGVLSLQNVVRFQYMSGNALELSELASLFTPIMLEMVKARNILDLHKMTGCSEDNLVEITSALSSGRSSLVHFFMLHNFSYRAISMTFRESDVVSQFSVAFREEVEDLDSGCDLLPLTELEAKLIALDGSVSFDECQALMIELRVRFLQALLESNIEEYAKVIVTIKNILKSRLSIPTVDNEMPIITALQMKPEQCHALFLNLVANNDDEVLRQINHIILNNLNSILQSTITSALSQSNGFDKVEITKSVLNHLGVPLADFSEPYKLASDITMLEAAAKELADKIREQANKGVSFTYFREAVVAAKLSRIVDALAKPEDSDTEEYKLIYQALHRVYLDHVLAHRFGIGGTCEVNGLEYDLDGSCSYTMVNEAQEAYVGVKAEGAISKDTFGSIWDTLGIVEDAEKDLLVESIFSNIAKISISEFKPSAYNESLNSGDSFALPTYISFGEEGYHANGSVIFKVGEDYFAVFSDRGGDVRLEDSGLTIFKVENHHKLEDYARRCIGSNSSVIPNEELKRLKEGLGLEKVGAIEKKPHKSGTCGYSSCAKALAQGIQYGKFYRLAIDKGLDVDAAFRVAKEACTIFSKRFSIFDRVATLKKYIAKCEKVGVKPNLNLLARIHFSCARKEKYADVIAIIDGLGCISTELLGAAEVELRGRVRARIVHALLSTAKGALVDSGDIDIYVDRIVGMYVTGYSREEITAVYTEMKSVFGAREEGESSAASDTFAPVPAVVSSGIDGLDAGEASKLADYCGRYGFDIDDLNSENKHKVTPLTVAVDHGDLEMAGILLKCGADVNLRNSHGKRPISIAREKGNEDIIRLLKEFGVNEGLTPSLRQ